MRINPLRSVAARLSLALLLVVAGALGVVYLVVIPSLQSRLVDSRIAQLRNARPTLLTNVYPVDEGTDSFAKDAVTWVSNARVVVFRLVGTPPSLAPSVIEDSQGINPISDVRTDPVAYRSATSGKLMQGTVERKGIRFAEVAFPLPDGTTVLLTSSVADTLGAVSVARQRLLVAGGIVLGLVLVIGYLAAAMFARRIRRLERAAERIASGRFDEPIVDRGRDEVGEVARAFDRMRLRLAQLDHARREFIANASHELRTPLFSLGGFLELMGDDELDPETRDEFLVTMREQVKRLSKLATELLDLSRLDAGHIDLAREPVSLAGVTRLVVGEFAARARQTDHLLEVEADESAIAVGDEQRIVQIVRNLVENALVHTPPGTRVVVRAEASRSGVSVAVEDDGPGVPDEQLGHVFERFYRGDGSQASGSGLGLAIALELARVMGGTLEVEQARDLTVFRLTLPAADPVDTRTLVDVLAAD
ncbi:MAG TPA: HAMP domain-containing sensor histidine kinase [Gaiellaceae bacterium]|nr:HAMP domain-containing sensor histidine kinase [Gaiellaceae bacterium]